MISVWQARLSVWHVENFDSAIFSDTININDV